MCHTIHPKTSGKYSHFFLKSTIDGNWFAGIKAFCYKNKKMYPIIRRENEEFFEKDGFVTVENAISKQPIAGLLQTLSISESSKNGYIGRDLFDCNLSRDAGIHINPLGAAEIGKREQIVMVPSTYPLKRMLENQLTSSFMPCRYMTLFKMEDVVFYDGHDVSVSKFVPVKFPKRITKKSLLKHFERQVERIKNGEQVVDPSFL